MANRVRGAGPLGSSSFEWGGVLGAFFLGLFLGIGATVLLVREKHKPTEPAARPSRTVRTTKTDPAPPAGERIEGRVVWVVDGDTIHVQSGSRRLKVRYLGIDTPESIASPGRSIQYYGKEASRRNAELVGGKTVRLEFDGPRTDRFGRLLCYIWVGDELVNRTLLAEGYARVYRKAPNIRYWKEFNELEQQAKSRKLGLWGR